MAASPMPITTTDRELEYRRKNYPDFKTIERKQIACATCGTNLSGKLEKPGGVFIHPFTNTLQCKKCSDFYGDGDFSMDEDGDDKYCRICGNGGELFICGNKPCPYGFCQKCIERYIGKNSSDVEADDWKCLHCNCKPLWEVRAVCAAVILEKPKKRSKHRTKSTRAEVYNSDDDRSRSRDLDDDFEYSKQVRRRTMRSMRNSKNGNELLEALGKICDDSIDSDDDPNPQHKPIAGRKYSNASSRNIESGAERSSEVRKKGAGTSKGGKELSKKITSSKDETSDLGKTQITRKKPIDSKIDNAFSELESKSAKQQNNRSSSLSLKQSQKTGNLSQKHLQRSKSPENLKNQTSDSDPDSSNESANDFVKSKKKKNLRTRIEQSSEKYSTIQKKKSNDTESTNLKVDLKRSNTKLGKVVKSSKILGSSLESKRTKDKSTIEPVEESSTNLITKENITGKMNTVETDKESNCSDERAIVIKESALRLSKEHKRYSKSENEERDEDKDPKIYAKVSTLLTVDKKLRQATKTKRLSTKPLYPISEASQASSSLVTVDGLLDRKKASIKRSYAKILSTKDQSLTKDEEIIMYDHLGNLITEIKLFSKSLCTGANVIGAKYLTNKTTSVRDLSKSVLKCALLMIRSKKSLNLIENEFIESYGKWCQSAKVMSIFSDEYSDNTTGQEVRPIVDEETSVEGSEKDMLRQNLKRQKTKNNVPECSNASNDEENCNVSDSVLGTGNSDSDSKQKSVETSKELGNPKSPIEIEKNIQDPVTRDSDADSKNSIPDPMSDCDSKEIFSEDESRGQIDQADESATEQSCTQSPPLKASKKRSIESDSDEHETVEAEDLEDITEKSSHFDNVIGKSKDVAEKQRHDNQEKVTECPVEKNTEEPSPVDRCIEDTGQPDSYLEETIHEDTTLNLNEDSKHSDDSNQSVTKYSETTKNLFLGEKSTLSDIKNSTIKDIQSADDDETSDSWDRRTSENNRKSSCTSKQDNKQKTLINHSSAKANESEEDLSDCDASIFTQLPSDDTITSSNENRIAKDPVENLGEPEDTCMSNSEVLSDTEIQSLNNNNSNDNTVSLEKETFQSSETIAKKHEEDNKRSEDVSKRLETRKKSEESENVVQDNCTALVSENEGNNWKNGTAAVQENETGEYKKEEATTADEDSEDAIKKKILESDDSVSSDESTPTSHRSNSFELKVNSDSDEYRTELIAADNTETIATSEKTNVGIKSKDSKMKEQKSVINSASSGTAGIDVSELNDLAKHRLLSSSDSSISDADDVSLTLPESFDNLDSHSTSSRENSEIISSSVIEKESIIFSPCRAKRKKFNLEKNYYYITDKKLQKNCEVVVRRLNETVLDQFTQLLGKSRERQELEDFNSLVDLNNIKKRKRGRKGSNQSESSSESASSKGTIKKPRSKQVQEKEETLLDHLEKMKNGENYCNPSGDESDENNDILKTIMPEATDQDEFLTEANKMAKDLLIQSSDSENETKTSTGNAEEQEQEEKEPKLETKKRKEKKKDVQNEEALDSESNHENGSNTEKDNEETTNVEENVDSKENEDTDSDRTRERKRMKDGLAKHNWRLTDSDSSDEEKKWNKSQLNKSDEKRTIKQEEGSKNKKKVKRRVLGSDSDSVKLTDLSDDDDEDDSNEINDEKKNSSSDTEDSAELFNNLRKKRRRKRNTAQKSDSDSDSDQDEKPAKQKRKRIKKMESDSDSDLLTNSQDTPGKLHRKNIRKVLKDKQVADVTKIAGKEEEERLKRIAERQKLYNEMYELKLANEARVDKLILDFDEETKKVLVSVHEDLVKRLKPHQAQGIKFMWDACFESLERTKSTAGSGCIVAHCMGLGKTFQVVTLAHTLLTHAETGIKTIMVICPLSTVLNWVNEFKKWLGDINNDEDVEVFEMTKMKKNFERKYQLEKWKRAGGVMVLGYEMFRLLSNQTGKKMRKSLHEAILKCLVDPGPDLIVCDEGHLLKNEDTALSKAMRRVKTLRRIVLTGTPLQNNLVEYHCMVQFVKPNLLGTKKEFLNRFVNPITNGQFDDSTEYDVKLMKKRAHVLHKMLEGSVQRFDYSVLTPFLPPKQEYVITVRLADIQIKLYQHYLDNFSRAKVGAGTSLFADFQALQRIWTHPIVLRMNAEKMERLNEKKRMDTSDSEGSLVDFLDDGSEEKTTTTDDSDIQSAHSSSDEKTAKPEKTRRGTRGNPIDPATVKQEEEELPQSGEWWSQFVEPEHFEDMKISSKLVLLFAILKESEQIGDKVLVFSQSLYALSLIEEFLNKIDDETQRGTCSELIDGHSGSWSLGLDYFRLDGQTAPENRSHYCKIFNNPKNSRARLFLISTRAGGLGINLTAANRVIIFDASWNPSHDVQSIFRIYRFGQKKPCYVYRFLAQGTMEEKIYNRQVTKLSLSCRVVDEQQIERHYSNHDLAELYQFEPNTSKEKPTLNLPKDRLLAEIFRKYEDRIETFHEHDSLLENKAEEELDEEERKEAWKEYEDERTGRKVAFNNFTHQNFAMQQYNDMMNMNQADIANRATLSGINIETLQSLIRKDYPNSTPEQQTMMTQRAIMDMYTYMENEAIRQQQIAAAAANTFTYPTVSNLGTSGFIDNNTVQTPAQRQYAMQQQQMHQMIAQREQQANYAKRFGNVRGPALSATATRPPQVVNLQDDNDVIEVPTTPPATAGPTPSSSVQAPSVSTPAVAENSKRQEE